MLATRTAARLSARAMAVTRLGLMSPALAVALIATASPAMADAREEILAGRSKACPGCDLTGIRLKRRDLQGADFSGAILVDADFFRADLISSAPT